MIQITKKLSQTKERYLQSEKIKQRALSVTSSTGGKNPFLDKLKIGKENDKNTKEYADSYVQDLIPVRDIVDGLIFLEDGRIVKMVEIIPINFTERPASFKDDIADSFGQGFKRFPKNVQIKCMTTSFDLSQFISNIRSATSDEKDDRLLKRIDDYIKHVAETQNNNSQSKRFFLIYEYSGDDKGNHSDKLEAVKDTMTQHLYQICGVFTEMGYKIYTLNSSFYETCEILYKFYNPETSKKETFNDRITRVQKACRWSTDNGNPRSVNVKNIIAPRGLRYGKWDYLYKDGVYETYLVLKDTSHPQNCFLAWPNIIFNNIEDGDMDIFVRHLDASYNSFMVDRVGIISTAMANQSYGDEGKAEKYSGRAANAKYIKKMLDNGEEMYEVCIVFTLRASTLKKLNTIKHAFITKMKGLQFRFEDSYMRTTAFFNTVSPYCNCDSIIFNSNKRNYTNSSLSSLFCITTHESFDDSGYAMGVLSKDGTLFSFDNFNSKLYPNPHIFIVGTTGAGKSFTELMLTGRMRMKGIRTMYILPLKGHEYAPAVRSLGGSFISLRPGDSYNCINICEIRPEGRMNTSSIDDIDEDTVKEMGQGVPLMNKKINSILGFLAILLGEEKITVVERSEVTNCLVNMYAKYGITNDNDSIWEDKAKRKIKKMPILEDLYNEVIQNPKLSRLASVLTMWVGTGHCSNMNGQTNVDLDNKCLAFDVNEDNIGEELLPAFMYIAFDLCYDIAKADEYEFCTIALDEVWKMIALPDCAKQVFKMIKILRGYGACAITATQDIQDCTSNEYGRSLISLSAIHIYLKLNQNEVMALKDVVKLSPENQNTIQTIPRGYGFVCSNADVQLVNFKASMLEELLYETDTKKKREKREQLERIRMDISMFN